MLSSTEMVMRPDGKMLSLEELIKGSGGGGMTVISSLEDLPLPGEDTQDMVVVLNDYTPADSSFVTLFDAGGDTSKLLDGAVGTVIPVDINFEEFYALKITGAYVATGEVWTNGYAVVEDSKSVLGKSFIIKDNSNNIQGEYTIQQAGFYIVREPWNNCSIDKIEGKRKAIYPTILITVMDGDTYKWVDIINKKEVN